MAAPAVQSESTLSSTQHCASFCALDRPSPLRPSRLMRSTSSVTSGRAASTSATAKDTVSRGTSDSTSAASATRLLMLLECSWSSSSGNVSAARLLLRANANSCQSFLSTHVSIVP